MPTTPAAPATTQRWTKPRDQLSKSARDALQLPRCAPRQRHPDEATPTAICNGSMPSAQPYRTGDGDARQYQRPGSAAALAIPSHGFRT